jgi:hypothetical protein
MGKLHKERKDNYKMIVGIIVGLALYPLVVIIFTCFLSKYRCEDERYEQYWKDKDEQTKS